MRVPLPLDRAYRLLNHGPTTLVSTAHGGRRNVMAAAWVMPLDFQPCKLAAVVAADTFTRELLEASGTCVVQLPTTAMVDVTYALGSCTGRDGDKFERFGLGTEPASRVAAPLVMGCAAWLECRVEPQPALAAAHDLFVLECLAAWADDRWFVGGEWRFGPETERTIHHVKGGVFFATGERLVAAR